MEGGGDRGGYQAAVFAGLVDLLPAIETQYDVLTGVSVGSLNAAGIVGFEKGKEKEAADYVLKLWKDITKDDIFKSWTGGIVNGILFQAGIFNTDPLVDFIKKEIGNKVLKRRIVLGAADANTAKFEAFSYKATGDLPKDFLTNVYASAAIPFLFPYVKKDDGKVLIDGGAIWMVNLASAITECRDMGFADEDIIVDTFMCSESNTLEKATDINKWNSFNYGQRAIEIMQFYRSIGDISTTMQLFPKVEFRYIITPSEKLGTAMFPLDFSDANIENHFRIGRKDAENAVKMGPKAGREAVFDYTHKKYELKQKGLHLEDFITKKMKDIGIEQ